MIRRFLNLKFKRKLIMFLLGTKTKYFLLICSISSKIMGLIFHFHTIEGLWKVALRRLLIARYIFLGQIPVTPTLFSLNYKELKLIWRWWYKAMADPMFSRESNKQTTFKFKSEQRQQTIEHLRPIIGARRIS